MVSFLLPHMSNHSTSVWQTGLPQTYNLFGFQDRTGLPGQRSLKGLNCNNLHHSTVAIEIIHILAKLQRKSIITYRCSIKNWGDSVNTAILSILHIMFFSLLSGGQRQEWQWHHGTGASLGHKVGWAPPGQTTPRSTCQESGPSPNVCVSAANGRAQDKDNSATTQGLSLIIRREFQRTQITYQSCNIMQYLDLRQEEQVSLESKSSEEVRQKKKLTRSGPLDKFQGIKLTSLYLQNSQGYGVHFFKDADNIWWTLCANCMRKVHFNTLIC